MRSSSIRLGAVALFVVGAIACGQTPSTDPQDLELEDAPPPRAGESALVEGGVGVLPTVDAGVATSSGHDGGTSTSEAGVTITNPPPGQTSVPPPPPPPVDVCASKAALDQTTAFHRYVRSDGVRYFETSSPDPLDAKGFRLFADMNDGTVTRTLIVDLHDMSNDDEMLSTKLDEGAYTLNQTLGYSAPSASGTLTLLRRYVSSDASRHLASIDPSDVPPGFIADGTTLGYVCPP